MNANLPSNDNVPHPSLSDLEWLAFCYLADELDETERGNFEARLANDPNACEALQSMVQMGRHLAGANPVELEAAVSPARRSRPSPKKLRRTAKIWWGAAISTAAILLLLSRFSWMNPATSPASLEEQMALAWVDQFDLQLDDGLIVESGTGILEGSNDFSDVVISEPRSPEAADENDWLFTALISLDDWPQTPGDGG